MSETMAFPCQFAIVGSPRAGARTNHHGEGREPRLANGNSQNHYEHLHETYAFHMKLIQDPQ